MRIEAPEFIPGLPLVDSDWSPEKQPLQPPSTETEGYRQDSQPVATESSVASPALADDSPQRTAAAVSSTLSADTPEFVPSASLAAQTEAYLSVDECAADHVWTQENFLIPHLLEPSESDSGVLRADGQRVIWELPGEREDVFKMPKGESLASGRFCVQGSFPVQLTFFPSGAALTEDGNSAVGLLSEEKQKLKFELFLNSRSSGTKVMLGKKFPPCDFRQPAQGSGLTIGIEVHENLYFAGFGFHG